MCCAKKAQERRDLNFANKIGDWPGRLYSSIRQVALRLSMMATDGQTFLRKIKEKKEKARGKRKPVIFLPLDFLIEEA